MEIRLALQKSCLKYPVSAPKSPIFSLKTTLLIQTFSTLEIRRLIQYRSPVKFNSVKFAAHGKYGRC